MQIPVKKDDDVTDLIVAEDELLNFELPTFNAVRAAYSKSFKHKPASETAIQHIEHLFPKRTQINNSDKTDDSPGFSIDKDEDPLNI